MTVLIVMAIIDQPMMLIILPAGIAGSYLLMALIIRVVRPPWRLPPNGADQDPAP